MLLCSVESYFLVGGDERRNEIDLALWWCLFELRFW